MATKKFGPKPKHVLERFLAKVVKGEHEGECWEWTGSKNSQGYGEIGVGSMVDGSRKNVAAHRFSFEHFWQEEIGDYCILHKCHNPACVRPDHLRMGTNQDNTNDMMMVGRHWSPKWEEHPKALLSCEQVREIRRRWESHTPFKRDGNTYPALAREFGVSMGAIQEIVKNRNWKGV